jgi:hypothetical protein
MSNINKDITGTDIKNEKHCQIVIDSLNHIITRNSTFLL